VHPTLQHFGSVPLHNSYSFPHKLDAVWERPAGDGDQLAGAEGMLALPACEGLPDA